MHASRFLLPILSAWIIIMPSISCGRVGSTPTDAAPAATGAVFFDLDRYFAAEAQRLKGRMAQKTLVFNQKREKRPQQILDYATELAVFRNSDINKPSWRDKYRCDTLQQTAGQLQVRYQALDPQLKTRSIAIEWRAGAIQRIKIHNRLKSIIAAAEEQLEYLPQTGYFIRGTQAMRWARKSQLEVSVEFLPASPLSTKR